MKNLRGIEGPDQQAKQVAAPRRIHPEPRCTATAADIGTKHKLVFGVDGFGRLEKSTQCVDPTVADRGDALDRLTGFPGRRDSPTGKQSERVFLPVSANPNIAIFINDPLILQCIYLSTGAFVPGVKTKTGRRARVKCALIPADNSTKSLIGLDAGGKHGYL